MRTWSLLGPPAAASWAALSCCFMATSWAKKKINKVYTKQVENSPCRAMNLEATSGHRPRMTSERVGTGAGLPVRAVSSEWPITARHTLVQGAGRCGGPGDHRCVSISGHQCGSGHWCSSGCWCSSGHWCGSGCQCSSGHWCRSSQRCRLCGNGYQRAILLTKSNMCLRGSILNRQRCPSHWPCLHHSPLLLVSGYSCMSH